MRVRVARRKMSAINRLSGAERTEALRNAKRVATRLKGLDREAGKRKREKRNALCLERWHRRKAAGL
jgi:hypothetical protein